MASKNKKNKKTTVIAMRDEYDWGKTLYNACYIFNKNLADYWKEYALNYEEIRKTFLNNEEESKNIMEKRNHIIEEKQKLKEQIKHFSSKSIESYRNYVKSAPVGECVSRWRKYQFDDDYQKIINGRKLLHNSYLQNAELKSTAIKKENDYKQNHLFETRCLGNQARMLKKLIDIHKLELNKPITDDIDVLYNFICSESQIERLMSVCINILNTYSEKEFSTLMNIKDRENIAEYIYNYFSSFKHNYDFIAGCYEIRDDEKLYLKDLDLLADKFYNGYFLTIRGFIRCSYSEARNEHFNIQSSDVNWQNDEGNGNHGVDVIANTENKNSGYSPLLSNKEGFSEGMISFWGLCREFLITNINDMADELYNKMLNNFPNMNYYSSMTDNKIMVKVILNTLNGIDTELLQGHNINLKLKHIILDSMEGAETKDEWDKCSSFVTSIIKNYMNKFFIINRTELYDDIFEKRFDEKEWN